MKINQKCPLCETSQSKVIFKKGNYSVLECTGCSFARLNKAPILKGAKKFYSEPYFDDKRSRAYFSDAKRKLQFVKNFVQPPAFLLDFGCGLGHFLKITKDVGFNVVGYDISDYAVSFVKKTYGIKAHSEPLEKISSFKNVFDVVVSWDVIEHVPDFMKMLKTLRYILKKDGLLFLTTPNIKALEARLSGRYWYGYNKIPEHVNFFSPKSIRMALTKAGFEAIKIRRWGFARDLDYTLSKTIPSLKSLFGKLGVLEKVFYLPLIDIIVVAQK